MAATRTDRTSFTVYREENRNEQVPSTDDLPSEHEFNSEETNEQLNQLSIT